MRRNQSLATWNPALLLISIVILVLAPSGWALTKYKTLYKFTGGKDGNAPEAGLIVDQAGNLYGTTPDGGTSAGTVFKLAPNADGTWTESVLYSFTGGSDGGQPFAGVILDQAGDLYGQASVGGAHGLGAVFKLTPNADGSWTESVLYSFAGGSDGATPMASLVFAKSVICLALQPSVAQRTQVQPSD